MNGLSERELRKKRKRDSAISVAVSHPDILRFRSLSLENSSMRGNVIDSAAVQWEWDTSPRYSGNAHPPGNIRR